MVSLTCEKTKYIIGAIVFFVMTAMCGVLFGVCMYYKFYDLFFFFIPFGCVFFLVGMWLIGTGCTLTEDDMEMEEI